METETTLRRVALEASGAMRPRPTGVGVYGQGLIRALAERSPGRYTLVYPWGKWKGRAALHGAAPALPLRSYVTGRSLGPRFALVHALDTRIPRAYAGPLVVTLFDLLSLLPMSGELGFSSPGFRAKKEERYRRITERANAIITLSAAVRDDLLSRFTTRARVEVIPPGVEKPPRVSREEAASVLAKRGIKPPFVLSVGALCPRKNVEGALRAFEAARPAREGLKLVLAGEPAYGWKGSRGEDAVRRSAGAVVLAGYLSRAELDAAYALAEALLHLSHYEGFGLTVLEALAAGTPVVASRRGGIPEAAGDAAWLVDPDNHGEAARVLRRILDSGEDIEGRRRAGGLHAAAFTWSRAAGKVENLYHEVWGETGTL